MKYKLTNALQSTIGIKVIVLLMAFLAILPMISAYNWDNVKTYDEATKTITIKNALGLGEDLMYVTLLDNTYACGSYCYGIFEINNLYDIDISDSYDSTFNLELRDRFGEDMTNEMSYSFKIYNGTKNIYGPDINNKSVVIGTEDVWKDWKWESSKLPVGKTKIKLEGYRKEREGKDTEWIVTFIGAKIDEWAWWDMTSITFHYNLSEGSGTPTILDTKGLYNSTAALSGDFAWRKGYQDWNATDYSLNGTTSAVKTNGWNNTYVWSDTFQAAGAGKNFTISFWANTTANQTFNNWLFSTGGHCDGGGGYGRAIVGNGTNLKWYDCNDAAVRISDFCVLGDSKWHHCIIVKNGTEVRGYSDGSLTGTINKNADVGAATFHTYFFRYPSTSYVSWSGSIDDFYLFNYPLNESEIIQIYNSQFQYIFLTINSETYNTTTIETLQESFVANITYNSSTGGIYANLSYNGIIYTGTKYGSGDNVRFEKILTIPLSATQAVESKTFYWEFYNATMNNYNSTSKTQTVNPMIFNICNSTLDIPYMNFTFKDETTLTSMNGTISSSTWNYWVGATASLNRSLSFSNTSVSNPKYAFCFSPPYKTAKVDFTMQYAYTDYPQREYMNSSSFTNSTTNKTLYLLSDSDGIYVTYQVLSAAGQTLADVSVKVEREIASVWTTVDTGTTGDDGGVTFWLNPDYIYRLTFVKSGYDTATLTHNPTQSTYTVYLGGGAVGTNLTDYSKGISYSIRPTDTSLNNNTVYLFNFTISSSYYSLDSFGFILKNVSTSFGSNSSTAATGGEVTFSLDTGINKTIIMSYYYVIDGNYTNGSRSWIVLNTEDFGFSIKTFFSDLKNYTDQEMFGLNAFSRTLIIFIIMFIAIGMISYISGLYSPAAISVELFALMVLFDYGLNLIANPVGAIAHFPTIFVGIIMIGLIIKEAIT